MHSCHYCGGTSNVVSSVTAFRAKKAAADARFKAETTAKANRGRRSNLPGDAPQALSVSKLPGDRPKKVRRPFRVFGSMREAFAVAA
tara:strand:+ start:2099 stop:2359 length:261 start_codon:yes stop_codon:yes gene_type:complete